MQMTMYMYDGEECDGNRTSHICHTRSSIYKPADGDVSLHGKGCDGEDAGVGGELQDGGTEIAEGLTKTPGIRHPYGEQFWGQA